MSIYSNALGDFVATPTAGTKKIVFSDFVNNVISDDLSVNNFVRGAVYEIFADGGVNPIPLTKLSVDAALKTLTILNMTSVFKAGDRVTVYLEARDKGFDEDADTFKTGGGGGVSTEVEGVNAAGAANTAKPVKIGAVYNAVPPVYADTRQTDLQSDENGRLLTATDLAPSVPAGDPDSGNPLKVGGRYDAVLPTWTDGDLTNLQTDINGRLLTRETPFAGAAGTWSLDASAALEASSVIKASPGNIRKFSGAIDSTAATGKYYLQFINAAAVPADGVVALLCSPTPIEHTTGEDTPIIINFPENGQNGSTGLVWCLSTTRFTKTIAGAFVAADVFFI